VRESFAVNWTLFPNFDKNIEYTIECISISVQFSWRLLRVMKKKAQTRKGNITFREGEYVPGSATLSCFGAVKKMSRMNDVTYWLSKQRWFLVSCLPYTWSWRNSVVAHAQRMLTSSCSWEQKQKECISRSSSFLVFAQWKWTDFRLVLS